jgi:hypothetical protein
MEVDGSYERQALVFVGFGDPQPPRSTRPAFEVEVIRGPIPPDLVRNPMRGKPVGTSINIVHGHSVNGMWYVEDMVAHFVAEIEA